MSAALGVWMNGQRVGTWRTDRGAHAFAYADSWLQSEKRRSLSLSLPITGSREIRGEPVLHFFDNLLPDNRRIRERISRRFQTDGTTAFSLLEAIGRDCVGAVQLLPEGTEPVGWNRLDVEKISDGEIAELLHNISADDDGREIDEAFRISLAGAQEKTALTRVGGDWCRPRGATPTTHILKLPLGMVGGLRQVDLSDSVQNEWLCAELVRELGLPVAATEIASFDDATVVVVERFDREWRDGNSWIARLPQEDFCQALGVGPDQKYEERGGPGIATCLQLLAGSKDALTDRLAFQLTQLTFWLLAACDGHAKNYSLFLESGDRYGMTPLYDILSYWPYLEAGSGKLQRKQAKLAMGLHAASVHYQIHTVQTRHWHALAMRNGGPDSWQAMLELVEHVEPAIEAVQKRLPPAFPEATWDAISKGLQQQAAKFRLGLNHL